jgi:phage shock protein E
MIRPLCLALALVVAASTAPVQAGKHTSDSIKTVKERLKKKKAVIIDVREKREWDNGHLEQAKLVPLSKLKDSTELKELMKKLPKDKKTIIYCH